MLAIVDYRAGNLTSVRLAFEAIGVDGHVTQDGQEILAAERVVFPGVGAAGAAMENLRELGLLEVLRTVVSRGVPFLGICIGMQLSFDSSQEDGGTKCIGLVPGEVARFEPSNPACKIPHMGWNTVSVTKPHPLLDRIENDSEFYFVHSYYPVPADPAYTMGETQYADVRFASAVGKDNLFATQFHPERSGRIGLKLLENFCRWDGKC